MAMRDARSGHIQETIQAMSRYLISATLMLFGMLTGAATVLYVLGTDGSPVEVRVAPSRAFAVPGDVGNPHKDTSTRYEPELRAGLAASHHDVPSGDDAKATAAPSLASESARALEEEVGSDGRPSKPALPPKPIPEEVRELVRRCDPVRNVFRTDETLLTFRAHYAGKPDGGERYRRILPERDSVVYIVDQALREASFSAASISVELWTRPYEEGVGYQLTECLAEGADVVCVDRIDTNRSLDENPISRITMNLSDLANPVFLIGVYIKGKQTDQGIFDRWPDSRQQQFLSRVAAAVEREVHLPSLFVGCNPRVWSTRQQNWIGYRRPSHSD